MRWGLLAALSVAAAIVVLVVPATRRAAKGLLHLGPRAAPVAAAQSDTGDAAPEEAPEQVSGEEHPSSSDAASTGDATSTEAAGEAPAPALPVSGVVVKSGPLVLTVRASGRAEALRRVELPSRVSERVIAVHITEGDRVRAGDLLVELDPRPYEIALREAEARLANAEVDLRMSLLSDDGALSNAGARAADRHGDASRDEISAPDTTGPGAGVSRSMADGENRRALVAHRTGYTEATLTLDRARLDLESTRITAPFDGEVASVTAVAGGQAQVGASVVTLVDLGRLRVPAEVLETDFGKLERGALARVKFAAFPDRVFDGTVAALSPVCDPATGTGIAYVEIENPDRRIRPGMYAEVEIASARYEDRLAVPRPAILERDRRLLVFRASGGRAEWQYVTTGLESESLVEITQGLAPGDTVLTGGHLTLAHGAPIHVTLE